MKKLLLLLSYCLTWIHAQAQSVTHIYTDFNGFYSSGVDSYSTTIPNTAQNLLAFRVGGVNYATGVNNAILDNRHISYVPSDFHALPVRAISGTPGSNTYVGLGNNYGGVAHSAASPSLNRQMAYYLTDGINGLDFGTGVYNIPMSNNVYAVDEFQIARIGDGMPDVIATQIGDYPSTTDVFKFVDAAGNTVGNQISVNFSTVDPVGTFRWAFYSANQNPMPYAATQPGGANSTRVTRLRAWDLSEFGLNAANVGNVVSFVHVLSGSSDQAFMAYNTTTFRALSVIDPGCDLAVAPGLWLQAGTGTNAVNNNDRIAQWKDHSPSALAIQQTNSNYQPTFKDGANSGFNFNAYLDFNNGNLLEAPNSPFNATGNNATVFIVGRGAAGAQNKILGFSRNGTDYGSAAKGDYPSLSFTATGAGFAYGGTPLYNSGTADPATTGIWQWSKAGSSNIAWRLNGQPAGSAAVAPFNLGTYFTHIGDAAPGDNNSDFDLAELIVFPDTISSAQRQKIESYLAIKYGIGLQASYRSGADLITWDYGNGIYNHRIAGIGREDCQGLAQKQSRSAYDTQASLTIGIGTLASSNKSNLNSMANGQYLVWGDDNRSLDSTSELQARNLCLRRSHRTWRLQRTGDYIHTQPTQLTLNAGAFTWNEPAYTTSAANYYLLIDRNGNGSFDDAADTSIAGSMLNNGLVTFNGVRWDSDESGTDLFTLAVKRAELPQVSAINGPETVNAGGSVMFSSTTPGGSWTSANGAIASVDTTGRVTGSGMGSTTIRYTVPNGSSCARTVSKNITVTVAPLPLELLSFTASLNARNTVSLGWTTTHEQHVYRFDIERAANGRDFEKIGEKAARNEATAQYTYDDEQPLDGTGYYRLRMIDQDGSTRYSPVRSITRAPGSRSTRLYPNPASSVLQLEHWQEEAGTVQLRITDMQGRTVTPPETIPVQKGLNHSQVDVRSLAPGSYMLSIGSQGKAPTYLKFIRNR